VACEMMVRAAGGTLPRPSGSRLHGQWLNTPVRAL